MKLSEIADHKERTNTPWKGTWKTPEEWFKENFRKQFRRDYQQIVDGKVPYVSEECTRDRGVYFLFAGDELLYIGQSQCIQRRLTRHPVREFDSYAWVGDVPTLFLVWVESYYIWKFQPVLNFKFDFFPGWMTEE